MYSWQSSMEVQQKCFIHCRLEFRQSNKQQKQKWKWEAAERERQSESCSRTEAGGAVSAPETLHGFTWLFIITASRRQWGAEKRRREEDERGGGERRREEERRGGERRRREEEEKEAVIMFANFSYMTSVCSQQRSHTKLLTWACKHAVSVITL